MSNSPTNADRLTATDYQYNLYNDYLDQTNDMLTKYGQQSGLSIQYWHIRMDLSLNYDGLDDIKMQNSYKHFVYDILHFVPTINMTSVTYQIGYDPQQQGTSNTGMGSFNIYLLSRPLPGDMFKFYTGGDPENTDTHSSDNTEIFRITNVRYVRSTKNKLDLYQLDFETAPIYVSTMEHLRVNQIMCWDTERFLFMNEDQCSAMEEVQEKRDDLVDDINKYYDAVNGWYGRCLNDPGTSIESFNCSTTSVDGSGGVTRPLVYVNTILKRLKRIFDAMDIKPIFGIGTAKIPIAWGEPPNGDYWDTFTCLSFNPDANAGELFNVTQILDGKCEDCPPELIAEIECHRGLMLKVQELVTLLKPLLTTEQWTEETCDRHCCDAKDINYIIGCAAQCNATTKLSSYGFDDFFWDYAGNNAGDNAENFCEQYENAACIPLYITWKDGAHWPGSGMTQSITPTRGK